MEKDKKVIPTLKQYFYHKLDTSVILDEKQEQRIIANLKEDPTSAKSELLKAYYPLIFHCALAKAKPYGDDDLFADLIQEGNKALFIAIDKFQPVKGSFAGYAKVVIENCFATYLKSYNGHLYDESLDQPIDDNNTTLADKFGYEVDYPIKALVNDIVECIENETDRYIIVKYLGLDGKQMNFTEIANQLKKSKQYVGKRYKKICAEIREKIGEIDS